MIICYLLFGNRIASALASWILPLAWHVLLGLSLKLPGRGFIEYWSDTYLHTYIHRVSKKMCKIVLSELLQISTNFDNFWHKDGKEAKIMRGALIFHLR